MLHQPCTNVVELCNGDFEELIVLCYIYFHFIHVTNSNRFNYLKNRAMIQLAWTFQRGEVELHVILKYHYLIIISLHIESICIDIFLPKSMPILVGVLYRLLGNLRFMVYLDKSLK